MLAVLLCAYWHAAVMQASMTYMCRPTGFIMVMDLCNQCNMKSNFQLHISAVYLNIISLAFRALQC